MCLEEVQRTGGDPCEQWPEGGAGCQLHHSLLETLSSRPHDPRFLPTSGYFIFFFNP